MILKVRTKPVLQWSLSRRLRGNLDSFHPSSPSLCRGLGLRTSWGGDTSTRTLLVRPSMPPSFLQVNASVNDLYTAFFPPPTHRNAVFLLGSKDLVPLVVASRLGCGCVTREMDVPDPVPNRSTDPFFLFVSLRVSGGGF